MTGIIKKNIFRISKIMNK